MSGSIKSKNKLKGNIGESLVTSYLEKYGYEVLDKNFSCNFGEIDVIFKDKQELVFAEIKTRTGTDYGFPAESVTNQKKKHILNTAKYFLHITGLSKEYIRFDVIEVYLSDNQKPVINHIKNVFW
ncbi:MAG: YraN family protein [Clostridia bacterium]|nr:YraN family protein [Clostridia bacterium]